MCTLMQINFQNGQPNRQFLVQSFKEIVVSGKNVHQSVSQSDYSENFEHVARALLLQGFNQLINYSNLLEL